MTRHIIDQPRPRPALRLAHFLRIARRLAPSPATRALFTRPRIMGVAHVPAFLRLARSQD